MLFKNLTFIKYLIIASVIFFNINCDKPKNIKAYGQEILRRYDSLPTNFNSISDTIDVWFKNICKYTRFNGTILVAKNKQIIYQNSYGYANYRKKDTLNLDYSFQIGSVSKPFTAMAIMKLKEQNLLNYNDSVGKYIKNFPYPKVSIWQLLTHRSGLSNYNYFCDKYTDKQTIIYNKDVLKLMIDTIPAPYFKPNQRFDYCNTNYVILASIVERVSKQSFPKFLQHEIFDKANMNSTWIFINGKQNRTHKRATGYHYKWTEALPSYQDGVYGDKNIYTTVSDLWRWNEAIESNKILKKETLEEAFKPTSFEKKGRKNYGLGWRIRTMIDSSKIIYHGGWWRGFNAVFVRDIKNNALIIMQSNVRTRSLFYKVRELLNIIDPKRHLKQAKADSLYMKYRVLPRIESEDEGEINE